MKRIIAILAVCFVTAFAGVANAGCGHNNVVLRDRIVTVAPSVGYVYAAPLVEYELAVPHANQVYVQRLRVPTYVPQRLQVVHSQRIQHLRQQVFAPRVKVQRQKVQVRRSFSRERVVQRDVY